MEKFRRDIRSIAHNRGIKALYHFTQLSNIEGILRKGLLSRERLVEDGENDIVYVFDDSRPDGRDDLVSVSIQNINFEMFATKRKKSSDHWIILELKPEVLWKYNCIFSWRNSATREIKSHTGFRGGQWAFQKMFQDLSIHGGDGTGFREHYKLESWEPTKHDAEMAVVNRIAQDDFVDFTVPSVAVKNTIETIMDRIDFHIPVEVNSEVF